MKTNFPSQSKLKVSSVPRTFHFYVGNLHVESQASDVEDYLRDSGIKLLSSELLYSSRLPNYTPRFASAHVIIDLTNKENTLSQNVWGTDVIIRPWRFPRTRNWSRNEEYLRW